MSEVKMCKNAKCDAVLEHDAFVCTYCGEKQEPEPIIFKSHEESGKFVTETARQIEGLLAEITENIHEHQRPLILGRIINFIFCQHFHMVMTFAGEQNYEYVKKINLPATTPPEVKP